MADAEFVIPLQTETDKQDNDRTRNPSLPPPILGGFLCPYRRHFMGMGLSAHQNGIRRVRDYA